MVIVAGHIRVDLEQRESYVAGRMSIVERARRADGCSDFAITADLLDPGRVDLAERWESQAAVETFRRSCPSNKQRTAMVSVSVAEYDVAEMRPEPNFTAATARLVGGALHFKEVPPLYQTGQQRHRICGEFEAL
jgi:quinol monooxygenase YgiN